MSTKHPSTKHPSTNRLATKRLSAFLQSIQPVSPQPPAPKPPASESRIRASRANGARSRGPKTSEGKRRSSFNALRHGVLANCVLLSNESPDAFRELHQDFFRRFAPTDLATEALVQEMVSAIWRLRRLWAIEAATFNQELENHLNTSTSDAERLAAAFAALADNTRRLDLIHRYETRLHLVYRRALQCLLELQKASARHELDPENASVPSEPGATSEHPQKQVAPPPPPAPAPAVRDLPRPPPPHAPGSRRPRKGEY
jgi:hypothetical protein